MKKRRPYVVCGECGRVYQTPQDLVAALRCWYEGAQLEEEWPLPVAREISFCPECLHDF